jgi:LAS superfamily LD-carboxypeptidase LdcB
MPCKRGRTRGEIAMARETGARERPGDRVKAARRLTPAGAVIAAAMAIAPQAHAGVPHTVQPGETLWSVATANGVSVEAVAGFNGLSADTYITVGQTIQVPSVAAGEAAPAAGVAPTGTVTESSSLTTPAPGLGLIPSPWGDLQLAPGAADAWNAMRAESLAVYGVDLYPLGPASAFRTYEQQAELYELFLAGQGEPADPPGASSHELGTAVDVATPEMRDVIDQIGASYGWAKVEAPTEWWHVNYVGG